MTMTPNAFFAIVLGSIAVACWLFRDPKQGG